MDGNKVPGTDFIVPPESSNIIIHLFHCHVCIERGSVLLSARITQRITGPVKLEREGKQIVLLSSRCFVGFHSWWRTSTRMQQATIRLTSCGLIPPLANLQLIMSTLGNRGNIWQTYYEMSLKANFLKGTNM